LCWRETPDTLVLGNGSGLQLQKRNGFPAMVRELITFHFWMLFPLIDTANIIDNHFLK
jgi:hypothetical protein